MGRNTEIPHFSRSCFTFYGTSSRDDEIRMFRPNSERKSPKDNMCHIILNFMSISSEKLIWHAVKILHKFLVVLSLAELFSYK